jgi:hypothetical protein
MAFTTSRPDSDDSDLARLLDAELAFEATTRHGLSNHLPMTLIAARALGADPIRLQEVFERGRRRLVPISEGSSDRGTAITDRSWHRHLGTGVRYAELRSYFDDEIARIGWQQTVRAHASVLVEAAPAAAFHGMIRLAYGIEVAHPGQIAGGLAYWSDQWAPLSSAAPTAARGAASFGTVLGLLRDAPSLRDRHFDDALITTKLAAVAAEPAFGAALAAVDPDLDAIAAGAVNLLALTDDFVALHAVTGTNAARVIGSHLEPSTRALLDRRVFEAVAAAYVAFGAPRVPSDDELRTMRTTVQATWDELALVAVASSDDHVIKLAHTARGEHARTGDSLYRFVAAQHAGVA